MLLDISLVAHLVNLLISIGITDQSFNIIICRARSVRDIFIFNDLFDGVVININLKLESFITLPKKFFIMRFF